MPGTIMAAFGSRLWPSMLQLHPFTRSVRSRPSLHHLASRQQIWSRRNGNIIYWIIDLYDVASSADAIRHLNRAKFDESRTGKNDDRGDLKLRFNISTKRVLCIMQLTRCNGVMGRKIVRVVGKLSYGGVVQDVFYRPKV